MLSRELARRIRSDVLQMTHRAKTAHVGSCLSCADILAVWYADRRDARLIVSKGHAAAAVYAALAETGHFPVQRLETYCQEGSELIGHVSSEVPGVLLSTGSLGHGLPVACGLALAEPNRPVHVLMSDAELDCGTTWEAALFAAHHKLDITAIIDANGWQACGRTRDVLRTAGIGAKWRAFGWLTSEPDGHDHPTLRVLLSATGPHAIIARTVKGKGVSFMEDDNEWHYRAPNDEELARALDEVNRA